MSLFARLPLVCLAVVLSGACRTTAAETALGSWYEVKTQRFVVWTDGDPELARSLVEDLEQLHQVMLAKTTAEDRPNVPPLRIFMARDRNSFKAWIGDVGSMAGFFAPTLRGNFAFVGAGELATRGASGRESRETLFHEYTHFMVAGAGTRVPSWYNEGFAEYMSGTTFFDDGSYTLGCPLKSRRARANLAWLPMRAVMEAESIYALGHEGPAGADSYLQSWYAVHYFNQDSARQQQLSEYLRMFAQGVPSGEAAEAAFGITLAELDTLLRRYVARRMLACAKVTPARPLVTAKPVVRPLSRSEAHHRLGDVLLALLGPTPSTLEVLVQAARLDPGSPQILTALGRAHLQKANSEGADVKAELDRAEDYLERAQVLASADPETHAVRAHLLQRRAEALREQNRAESDAQLAQARNLYRKAIRLNETLSEAYYGLGRTYLLHDTGSEEPQVVLEVAAYLLPLDTEVPMTLAQVLIKRGKPREAIPALEYIVRTSHSEETRARAQRALEKIVVAGVSMSK